MVFLEGIGSRIFNSGQGRIKEDSRQVSFLNLFKGKGLCTLIDYIFKQYCYLFSLSYLKMILSDMF